MDVQNNCLLFLNIICCVSEVGSSKIAFADSIIYSIGKVLLGNATHDQTGHVIATSS